MTNEELKKKIVDTILQKVKAIPFARAEQIADALIAAGIGFDKSHLATFQTLDTKLRVAEHRALVAERALYNLSKEFVDMQGYEKWDISILAKEIVVPDYIKRAEKELAEERKDD